MSNIQWHELTCGKKVQIIEAKGGECYSGEVVSFRKVMAIFVRCDGQYELFSPTDFNELYHAIFVNETNK